MSAPVKPDIYRYHDYRAFLKDWIDYQKTVRTGFSQRSLAKEAKLAIGYLPPVLSGARHISMKALFKLLPVLGLSKPEQTYLENLVKLNTGESQETRIDAIARMKRSTAYQKRNPNESELVEYMSHWYHIAIRELAGAPGFKADPEWIQKQLKVRVPTADIERALKFLVKHGYLTVNEDGSVQAPKEHVECVGGVYKVALTNYHRQMMGLAAESIDHTSGAERDLNGHSLVINQEKFEEARAILHEALAKIRDLGGGDGAVYHVEVALFPLTNKKTG